MSMLLLWGPLHRKPTGQWPTDFGCSDGMFEIILVKGFIKFFIFTKCHQTFSLTSFLGFCDLHLCYNFFSFSLADLLRSPLTYSLNHRVPHDLRILSLHNLTHLHALMTLFMVVAPICLSSVQPCLQSSGFIYPNVCWAPRASQVESAQKWTQKYVSPTLFSRNKACFFSVFPPSVTSQ